jgi:hypothetical protein
MINHFAKKNAFNIPKNYFPNFKIEKSEKINLLLFHSNFPSTVFLKIAPKRTEKKMNNVISVYFAEAKTVDNNNTSIQVPLPAHTIALIDCSGSMASDLPSIRPELKNIFATSSRLGDYISIVWFSGRGQCGSLIEAFQITSATSFGSLHSAIDNYLRPVGLTGFEEPLRLAKRLASTYSHLAAPRIIFMTDGCENQTSMSVVLSAAKELHGIPTVVAEKGWYCNRTDLIRIAEACSGTLVFREGSLDYLDTFRQMLESDVGVNSHLLVDVEIGDNNDNNVETILTVRNGEVTTLDATSASVVRVPEGNVVVVVQKEEAAETADRETRSAKRRRLDTVEAATTNVQDPKTVLGQYIHLHHLLSKAQLDMDTFEPRVWSLLQAIGDLELIEHYSDCFTKQDYSNLQQMLLTQRILRYAEHETAWFAKGRGDMSAVKEDSLTVLDVLYLLQNDRHAKFDPFHPDFVYQRISRSTTENTTTDVVDDEKTFVPETPTLVPIDGLVFNETRANVSLRVKIPGHLHLTTKSHGEELRVPTFIYRNYTMVLDGIVHQPARRLPVAMSKATFEILQANGVIDGAEKFVKNQVYVLLLSKLKIMNRSMVKSVDAKEAFEAAARIHVLKSEAKFVNTMLKRLNGESEDELAVADNESVFARYVQYVLTDRKAKNYEDANENALLAELKNEGLTEHGGYAPKKVQAESVESYMARELNIKIAKCSSIPTVNDKLLEKFAKTPTKATLSESLMLDIYGSYMKVPEAERKEWLVEQKERLTTEVRKETRKLLIQKWSILAGKRWFSGYALGTAATMTVGGKYNLECTAELKEIDVKI